MKKQLITSAILSVLLALTGCGTDTIGPASAPSGTETTTAAAESTAETATVSETTLDTTTVSEKTLDTTTVSEKTLDTTTVSETTTDTTRSAESGTKATTTNNTSQKQTEAATTTAPQEMTPPSNLRIGTIRGDYYYEKAEDDGSWSFHGSVTVDANGNYTFFQNNGGSTETGTVKLESEEIGDTVLWYYAFYNSKNEFWISVSAGEFIQGGNHFFFIGNGRASRLEINDGFAPSQNDLPGYAAVSAPQSGDDFLGTWSVGRIYITIEKTGAGYEASVKRSSSAAESTNWTYSCDFTGTFLDSTNGRCVTSIYDEEGNESSTVEYTNGCAHFWLNDSGNLIWEELRDNSVGSDTEFIRIS